MAGAGARYPSLAGKVVIVTGGASGIGRAMVEHFHDQDARVFFLDVDETAGRALAAKLEGGGAARFIHCDVTDTAALRSAIAEIAAAAGGIDVLINNAADDSRHAVDDVTPESWDACMAVNLDHQFFASQAVFPHMAARGGGSIICLGSIAWANGTTGMVGYTTAKAAINGLVRTLAKLFGDARVRVNALLPGWVMTERQLRLWVDEAADREIGAAQCLPDRLTPDDIAAMALFLAAEDSAMCTRQCFVVDGGWL